MSEDALLDSIKKALSCLEKRGDIVICTNTLDAPAKHIYHAVKEIVPNEKLSFSELSGLRMLIFQAISDKCFFDWEMPSLTGFNAEEFKEIAEKLPRG